MPKGERAAAINGVLRLLAQHDSKRQTQIQTSVRLYGNIDILGVNGFSLSKLPMPQTAQKERISYNVIQSCVDSITAKISKNKPKPFFLTNMGNWALQRKAKKLNQFVEGVFYENNAYTLGTQVFRDGAIMSDGFIHVYKMNGRVCYERVLEGELYTDWVEAFYGKPRQLHRVKNVDRDVLIEQFPEKKKILMSAQSDLLEVVGRTDNLSDQLTVAESWHLPSGPEANDGIHVISVNNEEIFSEPWNYDFFPFARFKWGDRIFGYWGQGLAEQLQSQQFEINKILWVMQRSMHLAGSFKVLLENSSKVIKEHLNNDIGAIITYTTTPPQYITPPSFPPEYFQRLAELKQSSFEQAGISMLSAASQKPAGLNSGRALREFNDIESDRFMTIGHSYENLFLELSKLTVAFGKELYEDDKKFSVAVPGKKFLKTIPWKDVDMEEDEYFLKVFPISSLPTDPTGRMETVQEWIQAGFVSPRQGRRLMDFPDLDMIEDLQNAEEDYLHSILEKIVDDGKLVLVDPNDDLTLARELGLEYLAQGKRDNLDEDRLQMLIQFLDHITFLTQKALPPPAPGATSAPQAGPMPGPQSGMIQNVPGMPQPGAAA